MVWSERKNGIKPVVGEGGEKEKKEKKHFSLLSTGVHLSCLRRYILVNVLYTCPETISHLAAVVASI
jgi:hypothetical protein